MVGFGHVSWPNTTPKTPETDRGQPERSSESLGLRLGGSGLRHGHILNERSIFFDLLPIFEGNGIIY